MSVRLLMSRLGVPDTVGGFMEGNSKVKPTAFHDRVRALRLDCAC